MGFRLALLCRRFRELPDTSRRMGRAGVCPIVNLRGPSDLKGIVFNPDRVRPFNRYGPRSTNLAANGVERSTTGDFCSGADCQGTASACSNAVPNFADKPLMRQPL